MSAHGREVHAAPNKARQACGRRRVGEPAVCSAQPRETEAYLKQYARTKEPESHVATSAGLRRRRRIPTMELRLPQL